MNDTEAMELDWTKRVNIIKGIAHGISYMHHECIPVIVHRDITSNNILLNFKFQTQVVGTYGYITPGNYGYIFSLSFLLCFKVSHVGLPNDHASLPYCLLPELNHARYQVISFYGIFM